MPRESMPEFRLFNTMTRSVEPFAPADGETVRIYSCGPTVYNPAHLGNFRTFCSPICCVVRCGCAAGRCVR